MRPSPRNWYCVVVSPREQRLTLTLVFIESLDLKTTILHTQFRMARSIVGSLGPTIVRVGWNCVIKGLRDPPESEALHYIAEHTTIPVARVRCTYDGPGGIYIVMDYIKGANLESLWMRGLLKPEVQDAVVHDMADILTQLWALHPPKEGLVASLKAELFLIIASAVPALGHSSCMSAFIRFYEAVFH